MDNHHLCLVREPPVWGSPMLTSNPLSKSVSAASECIGQRSSFSHEHVSVFLGVFVPGRNSVERETSASG